MFYGLAKELIPSHGFHFQHILQDIQTLNERATRGELDISAVSIHAYAYVSDKYALLPSGASMGDGYGPMLVAKQKFTREEILRKKIAVPGTMTSAFLALQLWLGKPAKEFNYVVVPFDQIFQAACACTIFASAETSSSTPKKFGVCTTTQPMLPDVSAASSAAWSTRPSLPKPIIGA